MNVWGDFMRGSDKLLRKWPRVALIAAFTLVGLGLQAPGTAVAATGDVLGQFVPTNTGNGRGIAFDGTHLYYTIVDDNRIYEVGTTGTDVATITPAANTYGGPLAWDGTYLWTMNYAADSFTLYQVDPADGHTVSSCNIETQNPSDPAVTGSSNIGDYPDGLDFANGKLWVSGEAFANNWVVQVDTGCTILREFQPAVKNSTGTSGVASDGTNLWHAYPETSPPTAVQTDITGSETGQSFSTGTLPIEDLAFDDVTFPGKCAIWGNEATFSENHITAFEVPCGLTVPGKPTINQATAGSGKVGLNWSAPDSDGGTPITSYTVYASPCPIVADPCAVLSNVSPVPNAAPVVSGQFTTFSYFVSGLTNGTTYTFTVSATNDVGEGDPSAGVDSTPNASADTNQIGTNGQGTVDTGFSGGARGCAGDPSDPQCKNIVGRYTITDPKDVGALIALGALPNPPSNRVIPCLEAEFAPDPTDPSSSTTGTIVDDGSCIANKYVLSTYPTNADTLQTPHLEKTQYDASVTTLKFGSPCFTLELNPNQTPKLYDGEPRCSNPNYSNYPGTSSNICPVVDGVQIGWTRAHPCAYIYYSVVWIPGYNVTDLGHGGVNRPVKCEQGAPASCDDPVIIGSTVSAGIKTSTGGTVDFLVRPWCQGRFPFTNRPVPCVFKAQWLNKTTNKGNNDIQFQEYQVADPGGLKTG
jgi:hypothetical protein